MHEAAYPYIFRMANYSLTKVIFYLSIGEEDRELYVKGSIKKKEEFGIKLTRKMRWSDTLWVIQMLRWNFNSFCSSEYLTRILRFFSKLLILET